MVALATWPFVARPKLVRNVEWQWRSSATCAVALDMRPKIILFRRPQWRRQLGSLTLSRAVARARARARHSARTNAKEAFVSLGGTRVRALVARIALSPTRQRASQCLHQWLSSPLASVARRRSRRKGLLSSIMLESIWTRWYSSTSLREPAAGKQALFRGDLRMFYRCIRWRSVKTTISVLLKMNSEQSKAAHFLPTHV